MFDYMVGNKYEDFRGQEMLKVDITDMGIILFISYNNPTKKEIDNISSGVFQFELAYIHGIIFFLFKFGSEEWIDLPYTPHLSKNLHSIEPVGYSGGYTLNIIFSNALTGEICSIGKVTLDYMLSRYLQELVETELEKKFDVALYDNTLNQIYSKYTTQDLLRIKL